MDRAPGRLDILINNAAGFVDWSELASSADLEAADRVMQVNLYGSWRMTQAFLPLLRASAHPRIVNVSSGAGSHTDREFGLAARRGAAATYGVSKAALNALTSTLAAELSETPVSSTPLSGLTATYPGAEAMGARPVADSAAGVVWAATLADDVPAAAFSATANRWAGNTSRARNRDPHATYRERRPVLRAGHGGVAAGPVVRLPS